MKGLFKPEEGFFDNPAPPVLVTSNKVKVKKYLVEKTVDKSFGSLSSSQRGIKKAPNLVGGIVGVNGFEPLTSTLSR